MTMRKAHQEKNNVSANQTDTYYFDIDKCKVCSQKGDCYREDSKSKSYSVSIKSDVHKLQIKFQQSEFFKEKSKERYNYRGKNSELKHGHRYDVSSFIDLISMKMQGILKLLG